MNKTAFVAAFAISIVIIAVVMFIVRQDINYPASDATSYANIARNVRTGRWLELSNPYWSPLYPALLSAVLSRNASLMSVERSMLGLQFVCHLLYALTLLSLIRWFTRNSSHQGWAAVFAITASALFGLGIYLKFAACYTPDLLIAALLLLAGLLAGRLFLAPTAWKSAVLGAALGVSYWAKAVMLPASAVLLVLLAFSFWRSKKAFRPVLLASANFALTVLPVIVLASIGAGKPTAGESGKLNVAWNVNHVQLHRGWLGREPGSGRPQHPPRVLMERPLLLEFSEPGGGTFPLWYAPALWHRGLQVHVTPRELVGSIRENLGRSAIVVLCLMLAVPGVLLSGIWKPWRSSTAPYLATFLIWPLALWGAYLLVAVELRYLIAPLVSVMLVSIWMVPAESNIARRIWIAQLLVVCASGSWMLTTIVSHRAPESRWNQERAAFEYLRSHGVQKGDRLAAMQRVDGSMLYLVPLDVQVVSWLRESPRNITREEWETVLQKWSALGVKAVVTQPEIGVVRSGSDLPPWMGFERVPGTQYLVRMMEASGAADRPVQAAAQ